MSGTELAEILTPIGVQAAALVWGAAKISTQLKLLTEAFKDHTKEDNERFDNLLKRADKNGERIAHLEGRQSGAVVVGAYTPKGA